MTGRFTRAELNDLCRRIDAHRSGGARPAGRLSGHTGLMASPPASTKTSLGQKLRARARERWPQLTGVDVRFRGKFAYVTGQLPDGEELPLCRLRYGGYASIWGFAIYRASHDDYQDSFLPSGQPAGTPEEALDCACGLYLGDPSAWLPARAPIHLRTYGQSTRPELRYPRLGHSGQFFAHAPA